MAKATLMGQGFPLVCAVAAALSAGTTPQLSAECLFKVLGKVSVTPVPFQGAGPALNAAMGGQIELASVALPAAVELVKAGKVIGLAVTSSKRGCHSRCADGGRIRLPRV